MKLPKFLLNFCSYELYTRSGFVVRIYWKPRSRTLSSLFLLSASMAYSITLRSRTSLVLVTSILGVVDVGHIDENSKKKEKRKDLPVGVRCPPIAAQAAPDE